MTSRLVGSDKARKMPSTIAGDGWPCRVAPPVCGVIGSLRFESRMCSLDTAPTQGKYLGQYLSIENSSALNGEGVATDGEMPRNEGILADKRLRPVAAGNSRTFVQREKSRTR